MGADQNEQQSITGPTRLKDALRKLTRIWQLDRVYSGSSLIK